MTFVHVESWLQQAVLAPSPLNTQPWRFRVTTAAIEVHVDPARRLRVADPAGREQTIACACALFNLRVAGAAGGCAETVDLLPEPLDPAYIARITLAEGTPDTDLASLAPAIPRRRSTRHGLHHDPLPPGLLPLLAREAGREGARLVAVTERADREALAALVAEADRRLHHDHAWRHEVATWMHPGRSNDGLPGHPIGGRALRFIVDHFDFGETSAGRDELYTLHAPAVLIIATPGDTPLHWVRAGQALQRVLLAAALHDLHAGYLQQTIQLADLRAELAARFTPAYEPQVCLRLGRPVDEPPPRRRRPIAEVAEFVPG